LDLSLGLSGRAAHDRNQDETRPGRCKRHREENLVETIYTPDQNELRRISELPTEPALRQAAAFLADLVRDPFIQDSLILPLIQEAEGEKDWYVARRYQTEDGAYSLKVFVWPSGTGTRIHDHSSWGAYCCASGAVLEERYQRLDDGSRPGHARLEKIWQLWWSPEDGASTVLPGDDGIHRVGNPGDEPAVSVHLYGPRTGEVDGRDYDPSREYVCDRQEGEAEKGPGQLNDQEED
jgi:predicted metal-dependent enzyme (double-stranded beta helix superfamily)